MSVKPTRDGFQMFDLVLTCCLTLTEDNRSEEFILSDASFILANSDFSVDDLVTLRLKHEDEAMVDKVLAVAEGERDDVWLFCT